MGRGSSPFSTHSHLPPYVAPKLHSSENNSSSEGGSRDFANSTRFCFPSPTYQLPLGSWMRKCISSRKKNFFKAVSKGCVGRTLATNPKNGLARCNDVVLYAEDGCDLFC
jgi:hypothetical protein